MVTGVAAAGIDLPEEKPPENRARLKPLSGRAIAELAGLIPTPTEGPVIGGHTTAGDETPTHLAPTEPAGHPHGRRAVDGRAV